MGWFGSLFFSKVNHEKGIHILVGRPRVRAAGHPHELPAGAPVFAVIFTTIAGMLIGLPTLRLRGDYIAIVTLAFGEIIGRIAINGDALKIARPAADRRAPGHHAGRQDRPAVPGAVQIAGPVPWYYVALALVVIALGVSFALRDSRLGRAWIALREDEVAAVAMGVPAVKTKLLAYGTGAAFGGMAGAFLGSFNNTVNADQFQFYFSILILGMVILGGLGSIWGVVLGAIVLTTINFYLIPDVFNSIPSKLGLDFDTTQITFAIYGFLLVIMMIMRPRA